MSGHGHVIPNANGNKARCGGPGMCSVCAKEKAQLEARTSSTAREAIARAIPYEANSDTVLSDAQGIIEILKFCGYRIVPEKMTLEMARACMEAMRGKDAVDLAAIWEAALSAHEDGK